MFKKLLIFFLCNNMWSENFLFYYKTCSPREKGEFDLFYYNAVFKDYLYHLNRLGRAFKQRLLQSKKYVFLNFVEKYVSKKKLMFL